MQKLLHFQFLHRGVHLCILLFCLMTGFLNAQCNFGVRTGVTNAWKANVVFSNDDEYFHKIGLQLSVLGEAKISKTLSLCLEPGLVHRINASIFFFEESGELKILADYLEFPLFISGRYPLWNDRLRLRVKAGYGMAVLLHAVREFPVIPGQPPIRDPIGLEQLGFLNTLDHGAYSGIGMEYKLGRNRLLVEAQYFIGLHDVTPFQESKNRSIHYGIGYMTGF